MDALLEAIRATHPAEWVAVATAILYLVFAIRRHIVCWVFAFISTAIYTVLFFDVSLVMESALNAYYLVMAVYGWQQWRTGGTGQVVTAIQRWSWQFHAGAIAGVIVVSLLSGTLLTRFTESAWPYIDSLTTWGAVFATWLVAKREITNWYYWLMIDALSIFLYWRTGLVLTALLFVFYLTLIPLGLIGWQRALKKQYANA